MFRLSTCLFIFLLVNVHFVASQNTKTSVLSDGDVFKFSLQSTGIYKLTYDQLKGIADLNIDNVDPRKIQIYNTPGGLVPQVIADSRIDDLVQNNILVVGEEDGSFDPGDFILLYSEGADRYRFTENDIVFEKNVYDLNNYFFLKVGSTNGLRIQSQNSIASPEVLSDTRERVLRHEVDRVNLLGAFGGTQGSGKNWFGEAFANQREQTFNNSFEFSNVVVGSEAQLDGHFVGRSDNTSQVTFTVNENNFTKSILRTNTGDIERQFAYRGEVKSETVILNSDIPNVVVNFAATNSNSEGWLDYLQIIAQERNVFSGSEYYLFDRKSSENSTYGFSMETNNNNINIWDISIPFEVGRINTSQSGNNINFGFDTNGKVKSFVAFDQSGNFSSPEFVEKINKQNLHGIENAEFIIVYHPDFREAAEKLANHRSSHDNLVVQIVDINEVYNEFGGGKNDPTALRDFVRMVKERDSSFRYLLLLGDATYDFRGILENLEFNNFVPTYETDESLHPVEAFPTDDYYALLSDNEGSDNLDGALDIGVGRIPCTTLDKAMGVVDKIIYYDTNPDTYGEWRMRLGFTADDEDNNIHLRQADGIATLIEGTNPELNQQKIYFDAYNQEATAGGSRYPDANSDLNANIFNGQLILNYLGHGGPKGWADERVLTIADIINWNNLDKMPVMITATCSFTGYDEPDFVSAGEQAILNPAGGAIALFTTVRAVYSSQNEKLTREVFKKLFTRNNGMPLRLGDIIQDSQNQNSSDTIGSNTRKFALIGDPSMRLALPLHKIEIDKFDGTEITAERIDTLGALQRAKVGGKIYDFNGNFKSDFNGKVFLTVYDKSNDIKTLDNDQKGNVFEFTERQNILYKGSASVTAGEFEIELILPKDINFNFGKGHFSFYATDGTSQDAGGFYDQVIIGGTSNTVIADEEGPEINIFLEDRSFVYGGNTSEDPILIIDLSDESGINLSGTSIGHDITATIDDINGKPIVLNNFYTPTVDEVGTGSVEYQLNNIEEGTHTLYVKAWDILNNVSEQMTEFVVAENEEGFLKNVYNYPNPFSTSTMFTFDHDLRNQNLDILINIYTVSGRLVKSIQEQRFGAGSRVNDINWNASDDFGSKLAKGVYLYKIKISSSELNLHRESDFQKLVILN